MAELASPRQGLGSLRLPGPGPWVPDPHLGVLLDADRLSALVGRPVRATRLRPKPGVKHVAALVDRSTGAAVGWAEVLIGPTRVKAEKARMVAAEVGLADRVQERALPSGALLVWGPVASDPRLARALAGLDLDAATLLRYNPMRRLVLRVGDSVVRVTAEPHRRRWDRAVRALTRHGVPVLRPAGEEQARATGLRPDGRVSAWQWVEGRDLSGGATADEQRSAGRLLARLHRVPTAAVADLERRGWPEVRSAAEDTVTALAEVAPDLGRAARSVLEELPSARGEGSDVLLHGDFSLDQCLAGTDGRLVLGDLDRLCRGPAEVDLGSLWAVALIERTGVQAVQGGYGAPAPHPVWVAAALLSRVTEPWRAQDEGWETEVRRRTALAEAVLAGGIGPSAVAAQQGVAPPAATSGAAASPSPWQVPSSLQVDDEVVEVHRAWPVGERSRVAVEGPDGEGRLRAATLDPGGTVRLLPPGEDTKLPALADVAARGRLVVHRAGRRAVVELTDRYAKVVRPGRAAGLAEASETGRRLVEAAGLAAPSVLRHDDSVVELSVLPGRAVHQLHADPAWPQIWRAWADSWVQLQSQRGELPAADGELPAADGELPGADGELPGAGRGTARLARHTGADEAQVLRRWASRAAATSMLDGTPWPHRLEETAQQLEEAADRTPGLVLTHRDLHDQQLLWDGTRLGVLDLDTLCLAEPALDPVNLAVHADLRQAQGLWPAAAVPAVLGAVASVLSAASVAEDRRMLAERATVARLAAVYAFRPRWRDRVLAWADRRWADLVG